MEPRSHIGRFDKAANMLTFLTGSQGAVRVLGYVHYDRKKQAIVRLDLVGVGNAWGNKMDYLTREIRLDHYPWMYGIACELVTGDTPQDRIPPYNLSHYNSAGPYFESR